MAERAGSAQKDPLIDLLTDKAVVDVASTLIAKLEHVRFDETRRGVFQTRWAADLFATACRRLNLPQSFEVDQWFGDVIASSTSTSGSTRYDVRQSKMRQECDTNWLAAMLKVEMDAPGFMLVLHNVMLLEDSVHDKLADRAVKEDKYDFLGVGPRNKAVAAAMIAATPAQRLLERKPMK